MELSKEQLLEIIETDHVQCGDAAYMARRLLSAEPVIAAAEKLVRCKGRYHSELNYRALAALFGVTTPDLPPLEDEQPVYQLWSAGINQWIECDKDRYDAHHYQHSQRRKLYLHPQQGKAVQVPDALAIFERAIDVCRKCDGIDEHAWNHGVLAVISEFEKEHRAAMLEPVSNRDELSSWVGVDWAEGCKPDNSPVIPDGWISVEERIPEEMGRYWCYVEEQNSLGKSHYQWNCSWNGDEWGGEGFFGRVTHWMPLPAAPQNTPEMSKSEKFDIAFSRAMENNKDTLAALAKK